MGVLALGLAACNQATLWEFDNDGPSTTVSAAETKYYSSDETVQKALRHFNEGDYGLSERYFRAAVEKTPTDAAAWVGLAASYDRLRRFDLADRAYGQAIILTGQTVHILNNQGYSYLLRGDLKNARAKFLLAYEREPNNPTVRNNLALLDGSFRYVRRLPSAY